MEYHHNWNTIILLCLSFIITSSSSTSALVSGGSDGIFQWSPSTGRSILQAKTDCPINIELLNYTILTSQCKIPYDPQPCCAALAELACPHVNLLNDSKNKCSDTLYSYLDRGLGYPPGLFSNTCTPTKEGIPCPAPPPTVAANAQRLSNPPQVLLLTSLYLLLLKVF
ncbi:hypothetical protein LIER_21881 [Lithospermum erythrorhizon]|uniref:GPI-anchored protein LLG1-like domain-containing protein n=1 Tax=Lithospermum erythrorhizon TaxID=34254 RepID=A0AAV3QRZ7_LITER